MIWTHIKHWWCHHEHRVLNQWLTVIHYSYDNGQHYQLSVGPTLKKNLEQLRSSQENARFYVEWSKTFVVTDDHQILGRKRILEIKYTNHAIVSQWCRSIRWNIWSSSWKRITKSN